MNIPTQANMVDALIDDVAVGKSEISTALIARGLNINPSGTLSSYANAIQQTDIDYTDPDSIYLNTRPRWWMEVPIPDRDNTIYLLLHCDPDEDAEFSGNIIHDISDTMTVELGYMENGVFVIQSTNIYSRLPTSPYVMFTIPTSVGVMSVGNNVRQVLCHMYTTGNTNITYWKTSGTSWGHPCPELVEIKARYDSMGQQNFGSAYGATTNAQGIPYANVVYYQEYGIHVNQVSRNSSWQTGVFGGWNRLILLRFNFQLTVWNDSFTGNASLLCIYPTPGRPTRGGRNAFAGCLDLRLDYWDLANLDCSPAVTCDAMFQQTRIREFTGILIGGISAMFYFCRHLRSVVADCANVTIYNSNTFFGCIHLSYLHLTNMSTSWGANIDLSHSSMTADSVNSFADDLPILTTTRNLILTYTPASRALSNGSAESLATLTKITDKNWTVTL